MPDLVADLVPDLVPDADGGENARLRTTIAVQREVTAAATRDRQTVLDLVAERSLSVLPRADGAVVELLEGEVLRYYAAAGTLSSQIGMTIEVAGSLAGLAVTGRTTVVCDDVETDPRVNLAACRRAGIASMLVTPLLGAAAQAGHP